MRDSQSQVTTRLLNGGGDRYLGVWRGGAVGICSTAFLWSVEEVETDFGPRVLVLSTVDHEGQS
jgi:hypothetical protein